MGRIHRQFAIVLCGLVFFLAALGGFVYLVTQVYAYPSMDQITVWSIVSITVIIVYLQLKDWWLWMRVRSGKTVADVNWQMPPPGLHGMPVTFTEAGKYHFILFASNCNTDFIGGQIVFKSSGDVSEEVVGMIQEPKPLLDGFGAERHKQYWSRNTATSKRPIIFTVPETVVEQRTGTLSVNLHWNFIGTRLEKRVPTNRVVEMELLIKLY